MNYYCILSFPHSVEKVNTIKALRAATGLGLRESKDLVEQTALGSVRLIVNADQLLCLTGVVAKTMTIFTDGEGSKAALHHYLDIDGIEPAAVETKNISHCMPY